MNIIFLDIDGVLNHELHCKQMSQEDRFKKYGYPQCEISMESVKILNVLIKNTGAKVVISSTWRRGKTVCELQEILDKAGFVGEIIGKTDSLSFNNYSVSVPRGVEIQKWIDDNERELKEKIKYVILDDDSDMLYHQRENFFWVDRYCGITETLSFKIERFFFNQ